MLDGPEGGGGIAEMSSIAQTELFEQPSLLTMNDDETAARRLEFQTPVAKKPGTSGLAENSSIMMSPVTLRPFTTPNPGRRSESGDKGSMTHTSKPATRQRTASYMNSSSNREEEDVPTERAIHAMDARQLTDLYFNITGIKKKNEGVDIKGKKDAKKASQKKLDSRVDLTEFKNQIG